MQPEQGRHWGPHATAVLTTLAAAQASAAGAARGGAPHLTSRVLESQDSRGRNVAGACDRGQLTIRHPANTPPTPAVCCKAPETVTAAGVQPRPEPSLPIETGASGRKGLLRGRGGATCGAPSSGWQPEGQGPPSARAVGASLQGSRRPKWDSLHINKDQGNNTLKRRQTCLIYAVTAPK